MSQVQQFLRDLGKTSDVVKKCTRPLHQLGVTDFFYRSIKTNGDYILLANCPEIDEYYYQEKLYLKDAYLRHPDNYQPGFFFFDSYQEGEFHRSLPYLASTFKVSPFIGLCEKQKDSVEFFGFWGEQKKAISFRHIYLNYANLIRAFVVYFKQECCSVLKSNIAPHLSIKELLGCELFDKKPLSKPEIDLDLLKKYLIDIGFGNEVAKVDSLSYREQQCITLLLHGKSTKETAVLLGLSPRTVEHYLENIKNKLNCHYKHELFAVAERWRGLNLIETASKQPGFV